MNEPDQEKAAHLARQIGQRRAGDGITDDEWAIIEERASRRDIATDAEVEALFNRYRQAAIDPAHLPNVLESLAQAKRRQFATDAEVEAAFRRFDK